MRVLLVHNFYGSSIPSGENRVFAEELKLLQDRGHEVRVIARHNDSVLADGLSGAVKAALVAPWNIAVAAEVKRLVTEFRPEIVHAHNTFPLVSPSIFRAARGAARVLTLHNYRTFCAEATITKDGKPCEICLSSKSSLPAVRHACYRGSRVATLPVAVGISLHRAIGTWRKDVDVFIALTSFQKSRLVAAGLEAEKVSVRPNFARGASGLVPWQERKDRVVYAGRLSSEKGVDVLVDAWSFWGAEAPELILFGDGPLRKLLEAKIEASSANVRILGKVDPEIVLQYMENSRLVVVPSVATESFGLTLIEAFSRGTPVLVSDRGPLSEIAGGGGRAFSVGDADDLLLQAKALWSFPGLLESMGDEGRRRFSAYYAEEPSYQALMGIYRRATEMVGRTGI